MSYQIWLVISYGPFRLFAARAHFEICDSMSHAACQPDQMLPADQMLPDEMLPAGPTTECKGDLTPFDSLFKNKHVAQPLIGEPCPLSKNGMLPSHN